jgi:riboflavin kinase/FMN adenylyltransferase
MEKIGLDCLIIHPFTKEFSRLTATDFVRDILVNQLKAKKIIIGYDHRFGRNRNANIQDLIAFGNTLDFEVEEIPAQEIDEVSVSSTKIRNALEEGNIQTANSYLGYPYMLTGTVEKGKGLGRTMDFPTANLHIAESYKLIPKNGVYVIQSMLDGKLVYGMMNIGVNPTVDGSKRSIEIHFLDYKDNLYHKKIQVEILHRLRDEQRFDSVEALRQQLQKDRENALALIS